ncbi:type II toxin-antitoxin system RelE/ParE family toxin [Candidatus Thiosymbion oneisti]|uniref:type II toxin-antitoxin system RelE/ParE family toxin n=1 Tax=Candidatus Thiosymbion oneisti TaxID=589554 RepID=UPI000A3FD651|nr:type II toxin-antitoxin system RelE/ParE family toxin [Candidatus Thiosymbion oneisti]
MISGFRHKGLEAFFRTGTKSRIHPQHAVKLRILLTALDHATRPEDMNAPGWRLHRLKGDLSGGWAVTVSGNWRLVFRFENGDAIDVDYLDYH